MERLTDKNVVGNYFYPKCFEKCDGLGASSKCDNCEIMTSICEKLGKYEDLEEQGRLIKLPCKVGDVVYYVCDNRVMSSEVLSVKYHAEAENHGVFIRERLTVDCEGIPAEIDFNTIGKTVFLTKSEAEAKLKELRGGENDG